MQLLWGLSSIKQADVFIVIKLLFKVLGRGDLPANS